MQTCLLQPAGREVQSLGFETDEWDGMNLGEDLNLRRKVLSDDGKDPTHGMQQGEDEQKLRSDRSKERISMQETFCLGCQWFPVLSFL